METIADALAIDEAEVTPGAYLVEDLQADSLDVADICGTVEDQYGIEISDEEELSELRTVQMWYDFIERLRAEQGVAGAQS